MTEAPAPNETELTLLKSFWRLGPLSAREVHEALGKDFAWAPSTTRTVLERMRGKGLLTRRSVHGMAVYAPAGDKVSVLGAALNRLMRSVLEVRGELPASAFAGSEILSEAELAELHDLLNAGPESKA